MDKLQMMKTFVAVAEEEGFSAASRRLNMSPPAVTRSVSALEAELNIKLLNRTTRYVRATDAGLRYLEDCRKILEQIALADEAARGINSEPVGHLCITAPVMFGRMYVMGSVMEYLNAYPKATVQAMFLDRVVNLLEEGIDLGIRIGELPDSSMRAIKVGSVRQVVCASPHYLQQNGIPQKPEELNDFQLISSNAGSFSQDWSFDKSQVATTVKINPKLTVSNNESAIEAAENGFGIARLLSYQIAPQLKSNRLKIVLEDFERPSLPVHIVHREGRLSSTKIRAFIDLLANNLRNDSNLN